MPQPIQGLSAEAYFEGTSNGLYLNIQISGVLSPQDLWKSLNTLNSLIAETKRWDENTWDLVHILRHTPVTVQHEFVSEAVNVVKGV